MVKEVCALKYGGVGDCSLKVIEGSAFLSLGMTFTSGLCSYIQLGTMLQQ